MFLKSGLVRFSLLVVLGIFQGCAVMTPPPKTEVKPDPAHFSKVRALEHWSIEGRAGIRTPEQSGTVGLVWRQTPVAFSIYMTDPLGQTVARLEGEKTDESRYSVVLQRPNSDPLTSDSAEQLLYEQTGWFLPFQALQDWVRGIPMQSARFVSILNDQGLLEKLEQDGWTIEYSRYSVVEGVNMPGRIRAIQGETSITVSVREWMLAN